MLERKMGLYHVSYLHLDVEGWFLLILTLQAPIESLAVAISNPAAKPANHSFSPTQKSILHFAFA